MASPLRGLDPVRFPQQLDRVRTGTRRYQQFDLPNEYSRSRDESTTASRHMSAGPSWTGGLPKWKWLEKVLRTKVAGSMSFGATFDGTSSRTLGPTIGSYGSSMRLLRMSGRWSYFDLPAGQLRIEVTRPDQRDPQVRQRLVRRRFHRADADAKHLGHVALGQIFVEPQHHHRTLAWR